MFKQETPCLHSRVACDRLETIETAKLPPIPEVVWQQSSETLTNLCKLNITINNSTTDITQETSKTTVASQTSPPTRTQPQNYVVATEHPPGKPAGNEAVPFPNCSKNCRTDIQKSEQHVTTTLTGDTTILPLTTTTLIIEEGLVGDDQTNGVYLPLSSTVVLKRKQKMIYVHLDFDNKLSEDVLVD